MSKRSGASESIRQPEPNAARNSPSVTPAGTPVAGLAVAEAHEVKVATGAEDGVHSRDVPGASGVVEDVEQPAVDDGVEGLAERVEAKRVEHLEAGVDAALGGLAAGDLDGARGDVDAEGAGAVARGEDRVLAGAAAGVEQCAGERAGLGEADEGRLRAADVPWRRRAGVGVIPVVCGVSCGHVPILSRPADKGRLPVARTGHPSGATKPTSGGATTMNTSRDDPSTVGPTCPT